MNSSAFARACLRRSITYFPHPQIPKRFQSTSAAAAKPVPSASTIWFDRLMTPFRAYNRALQTRPYRSQVISSLTIYLIGDLSAQYLNPNTRNISSTTSNAAESTTAYDPFRTLRAMIIGGGSSIPAYRWVLWLGQNFNYQSKLLSLASKVVVNQLVFTPLFLTYFFGMQSMLSGQSFMGIVERIRDGVPVSFVNSWKIWPAATAVTMTVIPAHFRNVFVGLVAIGWQTYLSLINARAARLEASEHKTGEVMPPMTHTGEAPASV